MKTIKPLFDKYGNEGWELVNFVPAEITHFPGKRSRANDPPDTEGVTAYFAFFKRSIA
ncbi:MAG: hypothetical protein ACRD2N_24650 [Vicinamibacterales bacterium]